MKDIFGNEIVLASERWEYIITKHPEIKPYKDKVKIVLNEPDLVKKSKRDKKVFLYYKYFEEILSGKYLLIVVKTNKNNFIITAYITDKIKEGEIIWRKN